jgi:hypothetical protein
MSMMDPDFREALDKISSPGEECVLGGPVCTKCGATAQMFAEAAAKAVAAAHPKVACFCGEHRLDVANLLENPFMLEGARLHLREHCGRIYAFSYDRDSKRFAIGWANPPVPE